MNLFFIHENLDIESSELTCGMYSNDFTDIIFSWTML